MLRVFFIQIVCAASISVTLHNGQPTATPMKSPKAVVEEFWKMDTQGGRLTDEGWRAADHFFVTPIEPPRDKVICVFNYDFSVWEPKIEDSKAEVTVGTAGNVWKIDRTMRLGVCSDQGKDFWVHKLVLTSKRQQFSPDHHVPREINGGPEWRFEKEGNYVYVTLETAIRYLTRVRDSTNDGLIKKNAEESLTKLKR